MTQQQGMDQFTDVGPLNETHGLLSLVVVGQSTEYQSITAVNQLGGAGGINGRIDPDGHPIDLFFYPRVIHQQQHLGRHGRHLPSVCRLESVGRVQELK